MRTALLLCLLSLLPSAAFAGGEGFRVKPGARILGPFSIGRNEPRRVVVELKTMTIVADDPATVVPWPDTVASYRIRDDRGVTLYSASFSTAVRSATDGFDEALQVTAHVARKPLLAPDERILSVKEDSGPSPTGAGTAVKQFGLNRKKEFSEIRYLWPETVEMKDPDAVAAESAAIDHGVPIPGGAYFEQSTTPTAWFEVSKIFVFDRESYAFKPLSAYHYLPIRNYIAHAPPGETTVSLYPRPFYAGTPERARVHGRIPVEFHGVTRHDSWVKVTILDRTGWVSGSADTLEKLGLSHYVVESGAPRY